MLHMIFDCIVCRTIELDGLSSIVSFVPALYKIDLFQKYLGLPIYSPIPLSHLRVSCYFSLNVGFQLQKNALDFFCEWDS